MVGTSSTQCLITYNNVPRIYTMTPPSILINCTPTRPNYCSNFTFYGQSLTKRTSDHFMVKGNRFRHDLSLHTKKETMTPLHAITYETSEIRSHSDQDGIGIVNFLQGKTYLITGATGMLGKALIEKMLRTTPGVGKIYVLVKAKDEEHALHRVITEIIECELFEKIKQMHGSKYYDFMKSKLVAVAGDVGEADLGVDNDFTNTITQQLDIIIHCAANTNFHERYDVALNINTKGPSQLMNFANKCTKLLLFLHVSTAYVNGERIGIVNEKPFSMGDSIAADKTLFDFPKLDIDHEIKLASDICKNLHENEVAERMKELGLMRAKKYGWADTYTFSKSMGEMMLSKYRKQVPLVIVRPSIIESTYSDPFPGWIQGNRMFDPLILSYGKGLLPGYVGDPSCVMDVIPVDMVVNTMISAMAKHGANPSPDLNMIYHASSSVENPVTLRDIFDFSLRHFKSSPVKDSKNNKIAVTKMKFFNSIDAFSKYISKEIAETERVGLKDNTAKLRARIMNNLLYMATLHKPYLFSKQLFDNKNSQKLMKEMSVEEQKDFPHNMKSINWQYYLSDVHVPAIKRLFARSN